LQCLLEIAKFEDTGEPLARLHVPVEPDIDLKRGWVRIGKPRLRHRLIIVESAFSGIMPAVGGRLGLLVLALAILCRADSLEDAVRVLAKRVAPRLAPTEVPRITSRNLSSAGNAELQRARAVMEQALRRRTPRNAQPVDITLTFSENVRGYLLVAQIGPAVEMVPYRPTSQPQHTTLALQKRLLWEQDEPLLDVAVAEDVLITLDTAKLVVYRFASGKYEPVRSSTISAPALRDPRGRLEIDAGSVAVHLPGIDCRGAWKPDLDISCQADSGPFFLAGHTVRFTPARNTLESNGGSPFFSIADPQDAGKPVVLIAFASGRLDLIDSDWRPAGSFEGWGGDLASVAGPGCEAGRFVLATRAEANPASDTLSAVQVSARRLVDLNESVEFPGNITALWPTTGGATVIVHDATSGHYAAYIVTVDCRR